MTDELGSTLSWTNILSNNYFYSSRPKQAHTPHNMSWSFIHNFIIHLTTLCRMILNVISVSLASHSLCVWLATLCACVDNCKQVDHGIDTFEMTLYTICICLVGCVPQSYSFIEVSKQKKPVCKSYLISQLGCSMLYIMSPLLPLFKYI